MAYDDKTGPVFPTRTGDSQGSNAERVLLNSVGGADGVRTKVAPTPDGGALLLRTRAGHPTFQTTSSQQSECLLGPLIEEDALYAQRTWRTPVPTDAPLVSTDGIFTFWKAPLTKWVAKTKDKRTLEFYFSTSFAPPGDITAVAAGNRIIETSWSERTWHPVQMAQIVTDSLPLLYLVVARLKGIKLSWKNRKAFTWGFNKEDDETLVGTPPACMAQDGKEMGLTTRTTYSHGAVKQIWLLIQKRKGMLQTAEPGDWLGALEGPLEEGDDCIELATLLESNITSLSDAKYCGQPWHGWMGTAGIDTLLGAHILPKGYSFGGSNAAAYNAAGYETHYVAIPGLPDVPTGRQPDDSEGFPTEYDEQHMQFLKDAVLFGNAKRYSPQSSFSFGANRWVHWSAATGVRVLRAAADRPPGLLRVRVYDDGALTFWGLKGTSRQLSGELNIPYGYAYTFKNVLWSGQRLYDTPYYPGDYPYDKWRFVPLNASSMGDRVLFQLRMQTDFFMTLAGICEVWELTVAEDLSSFSGVQVWAGTQSAGGDNVPTDGHASTPGYGAFFKATFSAHSELGDSLGPLPGGAEAFRVNLVGYDVTLDHGSPLSWTGCVNAAYTPTGERTITTLTVALNEAQLKMPTFSVPWGVTALAAGEAFVVDYFTSVMDVEIYANSVVLANPDMVVLQDVACIPRLPIFNSGLSSNSTNYLAPFSANVTDDAFLAHLSVMWAHGDTPITPADYAQMLPARITTLPAVVVAAMLSSNNTALLHTPVQTSGYATKTRVPGGLTVIAPTGVVAPEEGVGFSADFITTNKAAAAFQISPWTSRVDPSYSYISSISFSDITYFYATPAYKIGFCAFDPRTGAVRGSLLPDIGYL